MKTKMDSMRELFYGLDFYQYVALGCIFLSGVVLGCIIR